LLLVLAATATGAIVRPAVASTAREGHLRAEIAQLLNGERANRGLRQLPVDAGLGERAQAWAERNRSAGCEPPADCHSADAQAEILAWGSQESTTGAIVVAWMQSDTHRDILLHSQATSVGVGFACTSDGLTYITVQFAGIRKPVSPTPVGPVETAPHEGSGCAGDAVPLSETAPPPTTTPSPAPAPPTTTPATPPPSVVTRARPSTTTAAPTTTTAIPPTTVGVAALADTTTTTEVPTVVLSARTPDVAALTVEGGGSGGHTEAAWIGMVVVVVFLSALRIGFQLRDGSEHGVRRRGL
jgi:hypothetical protein